MSVSSEDLLEFGQRVPKIALMSGVHRRPPHRRGALLWAAAAHEVGKMSDRLFALRNRDTVPDMRYVVPDLDLGVDTGGSRFGCDLCRIIAQDLGTADLQEQRRESLEISEYRRHIWFRQECNIASDIERTSIETTVAGPRQQWVSQCVGLP
jgi:hypothetical protein